MGVSLILLLMHVCIGTNTTPFETDFVPRLITLDVKRLQHNESSIYELNCSSLRQSIGHGAEFIIDGQTVDHIAFHDKKCYDSKLEECTLDHCQCIPSNNVYIFRYKDKRKYGARIVGCQMRFAENETGDVIKAVLSFEINETEIQIHSYYIKTLQQEKERNTEEENETSYIGKITEWLPAIIGFLLLIVACLIVFRWYIYRKHDARLKKPKEHDARVKKPKEHDARLKKSKEHTLEENDKEMELMLNKKEECQDIQIIENEVIPTHIREQFKTRLEQWKKDDEMFVNTKAVKQIENDILSQSSVTLVGHFGTGKSFLSKHIALIMMQKHGFIVIPCTKPEDIRKWFKQGRNTLFVFDDVCGRYTLNIQKYLDWKENLDHITSLLQDNCCKIISTCRLEVYKHKLFSNLQIFKIGNINLSSEKFTLNAVEKRALAEVYLKDNADEIKKFENNFNFLPLLCSLYYKLNLEKNVSISSFLSNNFDVVKDQIKQMYVDSDAGKLQYCGLVLCVMFNNTLTEENLSTKDEKIGAIIKDLLEECELNKGTSIKSLKTSLEILEGTYVVMEDSTYKIIYGKLFDFLVKYFGEKMLQIFIDHASTDIIEERFIWEITDTLSTEIEFLIRIPDKYVNRYIDRLLKDWENGYIQNVCKNKNMNSAKFIEHLLSNLNQLDLSELVHKQDVYNSDIALTASCDMGTVELVKLLIHKQSSINYCRGDGCSPLFLASQKGHFNVVQELLQHSANVKQCNNDGESPLYVASQRGHLNVVNILLQHSANVNQYNNEGESPLYVASQKGHLNVVNVLLQHSAIVNQYTNDGESPLYKASQEGHVNVVTQLLQHSAEVDPFNHRGKNSLTVAHERGHSEVESLLLDKIKVTN